MKKISLNVNGKDHILEVEEDILVGKRKET